MSVFGFQLSQFSGNMAKNPLVGVLRMHSSLKSRQKSCMWCFWAYQKDQVKLYFQSWKNNDFLPGQNLAFKTKFFALLRVGECRGDTKPSLQPINECKSSTVLLLRSCKGWILSFLDYLEKKVEPLHVSLHFYKNLSQKTSCDVLRTLLYCFGFNLLL